MLTFWCSDKLEASVVPEKALHGLSFWMVLATSLAEYFTEYLFLAPVLIIYFSESFCSSPYVLTKKQICVSSLDCV